MAAARAAHMLVRGRAQGLAAWGLAGALGRQSLARRSLAARASSSGAPPDWEIRMLYDGECPLCEREVNMLKDRDAGKGKIDFVDIASPNYAAEDNAGISYERAMGNIHGILPDGTVVTDIEVFRRLYEAVGLGWVYWVTRYEPVSRLANAVYGVWAKYRLQVTGRPDLAAILDSRGAPETCAQQSGKP